MTTRPRPTERPSIAEEVQSMAAGLDLLDRMESDGSMPRHVAEVRRARVLARAHQWVMVQAVRVARRGV